MTDVSHDTEVERADALAPAGQPVEAAISAVVVLEDRAQVTRTAQVELTEGRHLLIVAPVTPLACDASLRCSIDPGQEDEGEQARLLDMQVQRRYVVRPARPDQEREITAAMERLAEQYQEALDLELALFHERDLVVRAAGSLAGQVQDRLVVGPFDQRWPAEIEQVFQRRAEVEQRLLADQRQQDDRRARFERLADERDQAVQPVPEYTAVLVTEVRVRQAGTFRLRWEYQVPCAVWRPSYTARLSEGDGASIRWESAGMVWQRTGEDWLGVELALSTDRPTLGADLPLLVDDVLSTREKTRRERDMVEVTSQERQIARTGTVTDEQICDTPPGLDDGGEVRTYTAPQPVDVPSDGRPHRLAFEAWDADAEAGLTCLPEMAQHVFLRSVQPNASPLPLLAGPVALIRNGGFIGRSQIAYVAQGERFELSWGSEDGLVVLRHVSREREETSLRRHRRDTFKVEVYLANHTEAPQTVRLVERVPVSEIEPVKVSLQDKNTTPGYKRDEQGLLTWNLDLEPGSEQQVTLSFQVSMPPNVHWEG